MDDIKIEELTSLVDDFIEVTNYWILSSVVRLSTDYPPGHR